MRFNILFLTLFILLLKHASAQEFSRENILFERISIPGMMRSASTYAVVQDPYNMLWFGTSDGLYRFDGIKFHKYHELSQGRSISGRQINGLHWDYVGNRLLVATRSYGVVAYTYEENKLKQLFENDTEDPVILNTIAQTKDGRIWVTSFIKKLFEFKNDTIYSVVSARNFVPSPSSILANKQQLLIGDINGVTFFEDGNRIKNIPLEWKGKIFPSNTRVTAMYIHDEKEFWIGTEKDGLLVYNLQLETYTKYIDPEVYGFLGRVNDIHIDKNGLVWILTRSQGLAIYQAQEDKIHFFSKNPEDPSGLGSDLNYSILEDASGIIWIGGMGELNKYDRNKVKFKHLFHNPADPTSISDNVIRGLYEDNNGVLWIGTDAGYLNLYNTSTKENERIKITIPGLDDVIVAFSFFEYNDKMLVGTSRGVLEFNKLKKSFSKLSPIYEKFHGRARQIIVRDDNLYILSQGLLYRYNIKTGEETQLERYGVINLPNKSFSPTGIFLDRDKNLWVGFYGAVARHDKSTDSFIVYDIDDFIGTTQSDRNMVLCIEHIDNAFWIGTLHNGLLRLSITKEGKGSFELFDERNGLPNNTVYGILPDNKGKLWLSTNLGTVKLDPVLMRFTTFDNSEGMQDEEFNRLAYIKTKKGKLVFGGLNGINYFNPDDINLQPAPAKPKLFSISLLNYSGDKEKPLSGLQENVMLLGRRDITLPYKLNFFSIEFGVDNYHTPVRHQYYYKLNNYDKNWILAVNQNTATYKDLRPGNYTFTVKTVDLNNEEVFSSIDINIESPLWLAWWFQLLVICFVLALFISIVRIEMNKNRKIKRLLQEALEIKTKEINESKEELERLNQKKDLIFSILSHDLRSPLTTLKGFLGILIDHEDALDRNEVKKHAESIRNSVTKSLDLIDNTLFWSLSQIGNIQCTPTNFELNTLIEKVKGLYQLTALNKRIRMTFQLEEQIYIYADENMMYVTLRNLVSNALKFTHEDKEIIIKTRTENDFAVIEVVDQGVGISDSDKQKLFNPDTTFIKKGTANEKGTGLGLVLCKQFVEANNGTLSLNSIIEKGSIFTIKLPLAKKTISVQN